MHFCQVFKSLGYCLGGTHSRRYVGTLPLGQLKELSRPEFIPTFVGTTPAAFGGYRSAIPSLTYRDRWSLY